MKKIVGIFILFFVSLFPLNFAHGNFEQAQFSDECLNAEQNDFLHFFCWIGNQAFNSTTPPSVLPTSGTFNQLTLKLHSRKVDTGQTNKDQGRFFWRKTNSTIYCYLSGFTIPNDNIWHDVNFFIPNSISGNTLQTGTSDCALDFDVDKLISITMNDYGTDSAWNANSVYTDPENIQSSGDNGVPTDRSLYFKINDNSFAFTSPINKETLKAGRNIKVEGICPVDGVGELAVAPQGPALEALVLDYNIDCVAGKFFTTVKFSNSDFGLYAIDKTTQSVVSRPLTILPASKIPVLIVPGVLGAEIKKGEDYLWPDITRMATDVGDQFMDPLEFSFNLEPSNRDLSINFVIKKVPGFDYVSGLINEFTSNGYIENQNVFTFPYDWRYGVSGKISESTTTVDLLKEKINQILSQTGSDQINIIAHSTGGLLVKKYVQDHPTDHFINKAIMLGVPNLGAPKAIKALVNGDNFGVPWLAESEMKKISQNLPVVYDLMPTREYYNQIGSFVHVSNPNVSLLDIAGKDLNYNETVAELNDKKLINNQALLNSESLHTSDFDNFDMRNTGVDVYNIIGCKSGTFGKFKEIIQEDKSVVFDFPESTSGDGTVPLLSAQTIPSNSSNTFFALKGNHGKMPSQDGIRQEIVNILTGSSLDTGGKILSHDSVVQNPALCQIKGEYLSISNFATIDVINDVGEHSGWTEHASLENTIPGADYEVFGTRAYVFLPTDENQKYQIKIHGSSKGNFTLIDKTIDQGQVAGAQVFRNIESNEFLTGTFQFSGSSGGNSSLILDTNGDTVVDKILIPSAILNSTQSQDYIAPKTSQILNGNKKGSGIYGGDVEVVLSVVDPVILGHEPETSGATEINYNLDGQGYKTCSVDACNISVVGDGVHTVSFYSEDKAANIEPVQTVEFIITSTDLGHEESSTSNGSVTSTSNPATSTGGATVLSGSSAWTTGPIIPPQVFVPKETGKVLGISIAGQGHKDGSLILDQDGQTVYLIINNSKHPFTSAKRFLALGFKFKNVQAPWPGDNLLLLGFPP